MSKPTPKPFIGDGRMVRATRRVRLLTGESVVVDRVNRMAAERHVRSGGRIGVTPNQDTDPDELFSVMPVVPITRRGPWWWLPRE